VVKPLLVEGDLRMKFQVSSTAGAVTRLLAQVECRGI